MFLRLAKGVLRGAGRGVKAFRTARQKAAAIRNLKKAQKLKAFNESFEGIVSNMNREHYLKGVKAGAKRTKRKAAGLAIGAAAGVAGYDHARRRIAAYKTGKPWRSIKRTTTYN